MKGHTRQRGGKYNFCTAEEKFKAALLGNLVKKNRKRRSAQREGKF